MVSSLGRQTAAGLCVLLALAMALQFVLPSHFVAHTGLSQAEAAGHGHSHAHDLDGERPMSGSFDGHDATDHSHDQGFALVGRSASRMAPSRKIGHFAELRFEPGPPYGLDRPPRG